MFPIFVINLENARERWQAVNASALAAGLTLTRIEAVDGRSIPVDKWINADLARFSRYNGRSPIAGEYGCHRSHLDALDAFVQSGASYAVIAEDDITFPQGFAERVEALIDELPTSAVAKLYNHRSFDFRPVARSRLGDVLGRTYFGPQGSAACYLLDRAAAIRLRKSLSTFVLPWDVALERGWAHGVTVCSTRSNVVSGTDQAAHSAIAMTKDYALAKRIKPRRLAAFGFRLTDFLRRVHYAREPMEQSSLQNQAHDQTEARAISGADAISGQHWVEWPRSVCGVMAILTMLSAFWIETDAYRYALIEMTLIAGFGVYLREIAPRLTWPAWLCFAWGCYVLARGISQYVIGGAPNFGSAEGIYVFPMLYPALGYGLFLLRHRWTLTAWLFILGSLLAMLGWTDMDRLGNYFAGRSLELDTEFFNNRIHGAVAAALLAVVGIGALFEFRRASGGRYSPLFGVLAASVTGLAMFYLLASGVRGAWLAALIALGLLFVIEVLQAGGRRTAYVVAAFLVSGAFIVVLFGPAVIARIGPVTEAFDIWRRALKADNGTVMRAFYLVASDPGVASTVTIRLQLWLSAFEVWLSSPLFGTGIWWKELMDASSFGIGATRLLHNGYLELLVRHGLIGLAFYAWLGIWSTMQFYRAARLKIITIHVANTALALLTVYLVSLLTNSNNRLALGEAFTMLYCSTAFALAFWLQHLRQTESATTQGADNDS
jgi:GR25 family glycosyltransferase involved in LPS biosynthesis